MNDITISFIIPHKGREQFLRDTIRSITLQDFDLGHVEVIVVTQNDKLSDEILRFQSLIGLSVYTRPNTDSIASLRNYGAEKANGRYLAFIDADISLSPDWINSMLEELHGDSRRVLISAIQRNSPQPHSVESIRTALNNINKDTHIDTLHGSNLFMRSESFRSVGGFPAELKTCEDVYFTSQVAQLGLLYLSSKASFIHLGEDKDHWMMFKKEIWRGLSNLHSFKGRKVPLREIPSLFIPIALMLFFLASLILLAKGLLLPSMISISLLLSPVIVYSLRLSKYTRNQGIKFMDLLIFYSVYFSARSIGTCKGLYSTLTKT